MKDVKLTIIDPASKDDYPCYVTDESAFYVSILMRRLNFSLKEQVPVWVHTVNNAYPIRSSWHVYQSMRVTDPDLQKLILRTEDYDDIPNILKQYRQSLRADWSDIKVEVLKWVMRLHLAVKYNQMLYEFPRFDGLPVMYLGNGDISDYECELAADHSHGKPLEFYGKNLYGKALSKMIIAFNQSPKRFLSVDPPIIENPIFLGSDIITYNRNSSIEDSEAQPTSNQILKVRMGSKSKTQTYLED